MSCPSRAGASSVARGTTPSTGTSFGGLASSRPSSSSQKALSISEINSRVNAALHRAIHNERSKRWNKVVENYRELLRLVSSKCLPVGYTPPQWLSMLLFECHYHLGLALQNLEDHRKAITHYSKAIQAVFIPKNGCLAGCNTNSCLMTPLYSRRAFANAKAGNLKNALTDAEKAVVLDSKNPDVLCVRALARSTNGDAKTALQDVEAALRKNSRHLCALILRGSLARPLASEQWDEIGIKKDPTNIDHVKACSINPDCHNFLNVMSFRHPDVLAFYERFLYSLSVPHTISRISLPEHRVSPKSVTDSLSSRDSQASASKNRSTSDLSSTGVSHTSSKLTSLTASSVTSERETGNPAFKAGTTVQYINDKEVATRRKTYGNALREHVNRPKTAQQYLSYIEKQRKRREMEEKLKDRRPQTGSENNHAARDPSFQVFQKVNVRNAPRMYYRPWHGDKLPSGEIERKELNDPPFKV